jgi:hypothetical protein
MIHKVITGSSNLHNFTIKMNKFQTFVSNNVLRIEYVCKVQPRMQIIPLKYITSVECYNQSPPRIVIQYNSLHEFHRTEMEYSSYGLAEGVFNQLQKGIEAVHQSPQLS